MNPEKRHPDSGKPLPKVEHESAQKAARFRPLLNTCVLAALVAVGAAIVVPNVSSINYNTRVTRTLGSIESMELAMVKLLADADCSSLTHLFDSAAVCSYLGCAPDRSWRLTAVQFERAKELYTAVGYAFLRTGRGVLDAPEVEVGGEVLDLSRFLNREVIARIGVSYLDGLGDDPWGEPYRIFPGPWPSDLARPIPFRTYLYEFGYDLPGSRKPPVDAHIVDTDGFEAFEIFRSPGEDSEKIGFPAPHGKAAFIWSKGKNRRDNQMTSHLSYEGLSPAELYASEDDPEYWGGGDDVNNWDNGRSWMRFYN